MRVFSVQMPSQLSSVSTSSCPDRHLLQPRRRHVSENLDLLSNREREDFSPLGLQNPWVSVTKLFSLAHKRLSRTKSSSSSINDDASISVPESSKPPMLNLSLARHKQMHTVDNTCLQEFMQDVFHVMKHGTYPPAKGYATVVAELRQVLSVPGGPDKARWAWYGHLLSRLAALLTQPITRISSLSERVPAALILWSNLQGCLAPLLQALWQPLPGMHAERDAVTVFRRRVLPLVSLRAASEGQKDEVLARHKHGLVDMLLLCSRLSWCSEDCCQQHNTMEDVNFEDKLLNMNISSVASSGDTDGIPPRSGTFSQSSPQKHRTAYRKTSAPSGYLHFRNDIIEKIDENDELVLQNHQEKHELFHNRKDLENSLSEKETWRETSCPAHLATLSSLDSDCSPRERFVDGAASGFDNSKTKHTERQQDCNPISNYNLSDELYLLLGLDPTCGTSFILAHLPSLLRLHHEKE